MTCQFKKLYLTRGGFILETASDGEDGDIIQANYQPQRVLQLLA